VWGRRGGSSTNTGAGSAAAGHWRCESEGGLGGGGGEPLGGCAYSHDGSLLALAAGSTATLWDAADGRLAASLPAPAGATSGGAALRSLCFLRGSAHLVGLLGGGDVRCALAAAGLPEGMGSSSKRGAAAAAMARARSAWGSCVVVWDLLAGAAAWYMHMPVSCIAADPAAPLFAVGVPALLPCDAATRDGGSRSAPASAGVVVARQQRSARAPAAAAAAAGKGGEHQQQQQHGSSEACEDTQQQQQQQGKQQTEQKQLGQQQQQQGLVLVFGARSAAPQHMSTLPGGTPDSLVFLGRSATGHGSAACGVDQQLSPLLVLTDDRRYVQLAPGGRPEQGSAAAAAAAPTAVQQGVPSGAAASLAAEAAATARGATLHGLIGTIPAGSTAGKDGSKDGGAGAAAAAEAAAAVRASVSQLFDAPSHVLPPPNTLCATLLELLLGAEPPGRT
jgi:NET1-associated nuclear protein 1 (U3 small nucleolar RNA-associated protein 17)